MTKLWLDGKFEAVTLLTVMNQEVIRYKNTEKDGYEAVVLGLLASKKQKDQAKRYHKMVEFKTDKDFETKYPIGQTVGSECLENLQTVDLKGTSKGKGYQGAMKRFHLG